jgi:hypothetical protein
MAENGRGEIHVAFQSLKIFCGADGCPPQGNTQTTKLNSLKSKRSRKKNFKLTER